MQREYDLFEQLPDGSPIWRGHVMSAQELSQKLEEIAKQTANECFAIHLPTQEIVRRINVTRQDLQPGQRS
jgi:hypothetical protein